MEYNAMVRACLTRRDSHVYSRLFKQPEVKGQAWLTYNVALRALIQKEKGAPLEYVLPKEGGIFFANYFDIVKNGPHPVAAQMLVNFMVSAESQRQIAEGLRVAPINRKVELPADLVGKVPYGDEALSKLIHLDSAAMNRNLDKWSDRWDREIETRR
jgi:putative spermidine/putrescine transport system substrate-binding protein